MNLYTQKSKRYLKSFAKAAVLGTVSLGAVTLLTGCLVSKGPLFPTGRFVAQTPIAPGYYTKTTYTKSDGRFYPSAISDPIKLDLVGQSYQYFEHSGKPTHVFSLFATEPTETPMLAQARIGDEYFAYQRVDIEKNGKSFQTIEHRCDRNGGNMDRSTFIAMRQTVKSLRMDAQVCEFSNPIDVSGAATFGASWPNAPRIVYERINERDLIALERLKKGPRTLSKCNGDLAIQSLDARLGKSHSLSGARRHVIAASSDRTVAVEAINDGSLGWAYLQTRSNTSNYDSYCKPDLIIEVVSLFPKPSEIKATEVSPDVAKRCAHISQGACGTLLQMISSLGGEVLLQGTMIVNVPHGNQMRHEFLTVVGSRGKGPISVLITKNSGATIIYKQFI